nr:hypothetical protein [Tanacetum cinerariifolium]
MKKTLNLTRLYGVTPTRVLRRNILKARHVTQQQYGVTTLKVYVVKLLLWKAESSDIAGGLDHVNPVIRLPIKHGTSWGTRVDNIMDGINIQDLTIEQYLRLTQENQPPCMVKKVDDMTIAKYIEYEERMKWQYSRDPRSYFPTYSGHSTSRNNTSIEFPRNAYFNPIQPNTKFSNDSEDMELDEEAGYTNDEESVMSEHEAIDPAHDAMEDIINNDGFTSDFPYQPPLKELNSGSFLPPFTIDNYNSYVMANIDASNNVIPRSIYEYLKLANLKEATMSVEMNDMTQKEALGTVKNVLVKIDKFKFSCDFVVSDMLENLGESSLGIA